MHHSHRVLNGKGSLAVRKVTGRYFSFVLHESLISFSSVQLNLQTSLLQVHQAPRAASLILLRSQNQVGEELMHF